MMMTSGAKVHYKSMFDAASQIIAAEGVKSLFKGAGANILRGYVACGSFSTLFIADFAVSPVPVSSRFVGPCLIDLV